MTENPAEITFASAHVKSLKAEDTLPSKFERLLGHCPLQKAFNGKRTAIKMHVGGNIGYTTIHPLFVSRLVRVLREAGAKPFVTDGSFSVEAARVRGYTEEVIGAPIIPAAGIANKYYYVRPINYRSLDAVELCGNIVDADAMIVLSHVKGHGNSGFGGAIKNLAMGCVAGDSRGKIHRLAAATFHWEPELCAHCYLCRENCPTGAVRFNEKDEMSIFDHHCRYCMHCVNSCPNEAISIDESGWQYFQHGMALATKEVLNTFAPGCVLHINVLTNITPLCDCWGFSTPSLVPDVGILGGTDVVAIEQASLDFIKVENYIPGSLPEQLEMEGSGHLFERIHGKDPYFQVEVAAKLGLGTREYRLVEIE
jgi:uncharacterized Fe-S center protein